MSFRNNLKNHIKIFGEDGLHSWNAGYDVNDDIFIHKIVRATRREVKSGDILKIRDNGVIVAVEKVLGVFLIVVAVDPALRDAAPYRAAGEGKTGKYVYGRVKINKAHVDTIKAP
ncbi:hypothetical protein [Salmonella enterica]